ncbi:hypothetical protein [Alkalilacustris brevis]|uniref:hypothetical protein n=1 Tax=Alkalilacustris brevis TaxID=2026338 RepID=UPI000E0D46FC|nr:hypothetical protein [Alkalilacustris brevis]
MKALKGQRAAQIASLADLAGMIEAGSLARLSAVSEERLATLGALGRLQADTSAAQDVGGLGDLCILARHQQWRQHRRAALNIRLAAQTAAWQDKRQKAARDVARADVARRLAAKAMRERPRRG